MPGRVGRHPCGAHWRQAVRAMPSSRRDHLQVSDPTPGAPDSTTPAAPDSTTPAAPAVTRQWPWQRCSRPAIPAATLAELCSDLLPTPQHQPEPPPAGHSDSGPLVGPPPPSVTEARFATPAVGVKEESGCEGWTSATPCKGRVGTRPGVS